MISSLEPNLTEWGNMISITFVDRIVEDNKAMCEYTMKDPGGVSFDAMDPNASRCAEGFLGTTLSKPRFQSNRITKLQCDRC